MFESFCELPFQNLLILQDIQTTMGKKENAMNYCAMLKKSNNSNLNHDIFSAGSGIGVTFLHSVAFRVDHRKSNKTSLFIRTCFTLDVLVV